MVTDSDSSELNIVQKNLRTFPGHEMEQNMDDVIDHSDIDISPPASPLLSQTDLIDIDAADPLRMSSAAEDAKALKRMKHRRWTIHRPDHPLDSPHVAVPQRMYNQQSVTTLGMKGLDRIFQGAFLGDQIVWEIRDIDQIRPIMKAFAKAGVQQGQEVFYFRFASHAPLFEADDHVTLVNAPEASFNSFVRNILKIVDTKVGPDGARMVFDCLSELITDWYSDRMLGNFFSLVCPKLHSCQCVSYLPLYTGRHSFHCTHPMMRVTQIQIDVVSLGGKTFIHPLRIGGRDSMEASLAPFLIDGDNAIRVLNSSSITIVSQQSSYGALGRTPGHDELGYWSRLFSKVKHLWDNYEEHRIACDTSTDQMESMAIKIDKMKEKMLRMLIARDDTRMLTLARKHFTVPDLLHVRNRMIGTGMIGGKSVGMLTARKILETSDDKWRRLLESHDSFFIGSDVFYTFLVHNQLWATHEGQRDIETFLKDLGSARERVMEGRFPEYLVTHFKQLLDYMGTSPIVVRSSSLQEDGYGNAFAGKYDSYFIVNQTSLPPHERLREFINAVRRVYASTLSEVALRYRNARGLLERDEQMAILVMRVSGADYNGIYMPMAAGVGLSYNPYKWSPHVDEHAGVLRLVFGLGTRAVDRSDDDYTRVVALNVPDMVPRGGDASTVSQGKVDCLVDEHVTRYYTEIESELQKAGFPLHWFTSEYNGRNIISFDGMLSQTDFCQNMTQLLQTLEHAYDTAVEIEFTVNFFDPTDYQICLVQCRPLGVRGGGQVLPEAPSITQDVTFLSCRGPVIGTSVKTCVDRLVYVDPEKYGALRVREQPSVGRLMERILQLEKPSSNGYDSVPSADELARRVVVLVGPGRWGTSHAELGVPCSSTHLKYAACVVEIQELGDIIPDGSLGTHFFNEMVEANMLYAAVDPRHAADYINREFCNQFTNVLCDILPDIDPKWANVVKVIDQVPQGKLMLFGDNPNQTFFLYIEQ